MRRKLFTLFLALVAGVGTMFASDTSVDGIWYNFNDDDLTAEVTYQGDDYNSNSDRYSGEVVIPSSVIYNSVTYSVTSIGYSAFAYCSSLTSVTIPNSVTSIGAQAFWGCSSLTSVTIPNSVTSIGEFAFYYCTGLTSVTIPNSVTSIGSRAFDGCSGLTSMSVEAGNAIYDSRNNCNAIIETESNTLIAGCKNTIIPNSVTSIGYYAFHACSGLTSVTIPNSVTSIGEYTFYNCSSLTSVTIPNSVTSIGGTAFSNCSGLTSITCEAVNPPALGNAVFDEVDKSIPLYVPAEGVAAYQAAEGWKEFTNIQAIKSSGGDTPMFPDDPGTLTYRLELHAAVVDGDTIAGQAPAGAGGYPAGTEATITARDIPGYEFVQWSDSVTDMTRTIVVNESMTLTALYNHSMIEIPVAANQWNFICLPPLGDRQYTEDLFTYVGLTDVKWGIYSGNRRAEGRSGWETPETFNALQGYILYSTTAGTLKINAYVDDIRQGDSNTISAPLSAYASGHTENANWNFLGNPYSQGFNISAFADAGIESPITVWNGTGYTTYTPGIDDYTLQPFEAFFIQKPEGTGAPEAITFIR